MGRTLSAAAGRRQEAGQVEAGPRGPGGARSRRGAGGAEGRDGRGPSGGAREARRWWPARALAWWGPLPGAGWPPRPTAAPSSWLRLTPAAARPAALRRRVQLLAG